MTIRKQAIAGVKWTSISTISIAVTQVIKISVLARFLEKSDFGLMALVVFVLGFMNLFMDMGLTTAILHKQNISKNEYASLYWLNFGFSIFLYLIIIAITPLVTDFYKEKELLILLPLMGLSLIISAFGRQFKTIEQKQLHFKFIGIVDIITSIISLFFAIVLAVKGYGVYALVYAALLGYIFSNTIFLMLGLKSSYLKFHFSYHETKPFLRIGIYQVGSQVVNYFNRDLDILIIGKVFGAEILGGYSLAKQLVFRPAQIINPILTRVASPILARFQNNIESLKENFLKLLNIVAKINILIYIGIIIFARPIVHILYGKNFDDIVILVQILSIYMIFRAIGNPVGSLIIATGRTDLGFYWNLIMLAVLPLAIVIGAQFSIEWVAGALVIAMALLFVPAWYFLIFRMVHIPFGLYIKSIFFDLSTFKRLNIKK